MREQPESLFADDESLCESDVFEWLAAEIRAGRRGVAELILAECPWHQFDAEFPLDLVYREFLTLKEVGEEPDPVAFCARFPRYETRLRRLLEVDQALKTEFDSLRIAGGGETVAEDLADGGALSQTGFVGKYQLLEEIGRGGSSRVYKAIQTDLSRVVAIKLQKIHTDEFDTRRRFRQEAEFIAKLQHPGIVQLYDFGVSGGQLYLVLEYVDGGELTSWCGDRLTPREIIEIMIQLADAVEFSNRCQIIHRDLKPSNILMTTGGIPKLSDFGLGKKLEPVDSSGSTIMGSTLGTPSYMAPELTSTGTEEIGPATDVYGLGAIFYQLLTGRPPFLAGSVVETLRLVREQDPVSPKRLRPDLSKDIDVVCLRCLNKEPDRRFSSAAELKDELLRLRDGVPIRSRPVGLVEKSWRWCRRRPLAASLLVALALAVSIGVGGVFWQWQNAQAQASLAESKRQLAETNLEAAKQAIDELTQISLELDAIPQTHAIRERALRKVLEFYTRGVPAPVTDDESQLALANTYQRTGNIRLNLMDNRKALEDLQHAAQLYTDLATRHPEEKEFIRLAGYTNFLMGIVHRSSEEWNPSLERFLEASRWYQKLVKIAPTDQHRIWLANAYVNAATSVSTSTEFSLAEKLHSQAWTEYRKVEDQTLPGYLFEVGLLLEAKANIRFDRGDCFSALEQVLAGIEYHDRASKAGFNSRHGDNRTYLARKFRLAALAMYHLHPDLSNWQAYLADAENQIRAAWQSQPEMPFVAIMYASILECSAMLKWQQGDDAGSFQHYSDCIRILERASGRFSGQEQVVSALARVLVTCPFEQLRNPGEAHQLVLSARSINPGSRHLRRAALLYHSTYGDPVVAITGMWAEETGFSQPLEAAMLDLIRHRLGLAGSRDDTIVDELNQADRVNESVPVNEPVPLEDRFTIRHMKRLQTPSDDFHPGR